MAQKLGQEWSKIVARYQTPDARQASWQIVNTFAPFLLIWYLAYLSLSYSCAKAPPHILGEPQDYLALWDEDRQELVSLGSLKSIQRAAN